METSDAVVIVTGAGRGLGKAIAAAYAAAGAKVALTDVVADTLAETAAELEAAGGEVLAIPCDITIAQQVEAMAQQVKQQLGVPAILINSAGSLTALGPIWQVDQDRWCRDVNVNLCGTFLVCKHVVAQMIAEKRGYVISLVGAGVDKPHLYTTGYDSSKAGVVRLMEALTKEADEFGIKAFTLSPGPVRTAMTEFILNSPEGRRWRPTFKNIFDEGRDAPPSRAVDWCLALTSGRADELTGRWLDATKDFDQTIAKSAEILAGERQVLRLT